MCHIDHTTTPTQNTTNASPTVISHHLLKALELATLELKELRVGNCTDIIPAESLKMGLPLSFLSFFFFRFLEEKSLWDVLRNGFAAILTRLDLRLEVFGRGLGYGY